MLTITILKTDLETANYMDAADCPITRALKRAGRPDLRDNGMGIEDETHFTVVPHTIPEYWEMRRKVMSMMYSAKTLRRTESEEGLGTIAHTPAVPPEDFSVTLPI